MLAEIGVRRDFPVLAALAGPDRDHALAGGQLHVVQIECDDLAQP